MFYLSLWAGGSKEMSYYLFSFHINRPSRVNCLFQIVSTILQSVIYDSIFFL